jgi:molybdopterin-synthase adenylyltransferase
MTLSARDRARYARHLLLSEIGEAGQAKLCAARVHPAAGDEGVARTALDYLARAGVQTAEDGVAVALADREQALRVAGDESLVEAARALLGAIAAVDVMRDVVGFGGVGEQPIPSLSVRAEEA